MSRLITIAFLLLGTTAGFAETIHVCQNCEVKSIKEAIDLAEDGDRVEVAYGIYKEGNILVNKRISLIGLDYPVLDGENKTEILTITRDSVTIEGFQIQNVGVSYTKDIAGINVVRSDYVSIKGNKLINTFFGIYYQKSNNGYILDNQIVGNAEQEMSSGNAIHLWYCKGMTISNNTIDQHRDGIYLEFVDDSHISNNTSQHNIRYGLHFMFSNHDAYINNRFINNGAGVAVMFSRDIEMKGNLFHHNWGTTSYGLLLKEIYDAEIVSNDFTKNTIAIYGESATRINIKNNEFKQNGWALKLLGSSMDNRIQGNNFFNNTFDVTTNSSRNYNDYTGNYWNEYNGYDLNKDGIGDVPHRPVKLYSYIVARTESSIILLRSLFVDLLNFAEKVTPVFSPASLVDNQPLMKPNHD